jgi:hypothetical protein
MRVEYLVQPSYWARREEANTIKHTNKHTNKQREQLGKTTAVSWIPDSSSLLPQRRQNMQEEFHFIGIA